MAFKAQGEEYFPRFAAVRLFRVFEHRQFDELLGNGAAAGRGRTADEVLDCRPQERTGNDAGVFEKFFVLCRDDGVDKVRGDVFQFHEHAIVRCAQFTAADWFAVLVEQETRQCELFDVLF